MDEEIVSFAGIGSCADFLCNVAEVVESDTHRKAPDRTNDRTSSGVLSTSGQDKYYRGGWSTAKAVGI